MTANKFNIGDAVRWNGKGNIKMKIIAYDVCDCLRINEYSNPNENEYWFVYPRDLKPWSDKLHCPFCGAEIEIHDYSGGESDGLCWGDNSLRHSSNCPVDRSRKLFDTEQEALDAYSMRWEG